MPGGAAMFVAPLLALVAVWAVVVPLFQINPRVFPSVGAVGTAALESIRDGTLIAHIGASLLRVGLGTLIGIITAVPLGIAMGVSAGVAAFLTPLFRSSRFWRASRGFRLRRCGSATVSAPSCSSSSTRYFSSWPTTPCSV